MNFRNAYKIIIIILEAVNDSGFILGCLAWDILKTLVSREVYLYQHLENVSLCANLEDS